MGWMLPHMGKKCATVLNYKIAGENSQVPKKTGCVGHRLMCQPHDYLSPARMRTSLYQISDNVIFSFDWITK